MDVSVHKLFVHPNINDLLLFGNRWDWKFEIHKYILIQVLDCRRVVINKTLRHYYLITKKNLDLYSLFVGLVRNIPLFKHVCPFKFPTYTTLPIVPSLVISTSLS